VPHYKALAIDIGANALHPAGMISLWGLHRILNSSSFSHNVIVHFLLQRNPNPDELTMSKS
jgi:hypothetical protein